MTTVEKLHIVKDVEGTGCELIAQISRNNYSWFVSCKMSGTWVIDNTGFVPRFADENRDFVYADDTDLFKTYTNMTVIFRTSHPFGWGMRELNYNGLVVIMGNKYWTEQQSGREVYTLCRSTDAELRNIRMIFKSVQQEVYNGVGLDIYTFTIRTRVGWIKLVGFDSECFPQYKHNYSIVPFCTNKFRLQINQEDICELFPYSLDAFITHGGFKNLGTVQAANCTITNSFVGDRVLQGGDNTIVVYTLPDDKAGIRKAVIRK